MKSLPNYLQSQRKRLSLTQEEVGFLLGIGGMYKGAKVCRDENFAREPSLREALTYEAMYGRPVSDGNVDRRSALNIGLAMPRGLRYFRWPANIRA